MLSRCPNMWWSLLVLTLLSSQSTNASDVPPGAARLQLENGDFYEGALADSDAPNLLRWKAKIADEPFGFPMSAVASASFPTTHSPPDAGGFCVQLFAGDVLYGELTGLDRESIEIESDRFGKLKFAAEKILRAFRCDEENGLLYFGPSGLADWMLGEGDGQWRSFSGRLQANGARALRHSVDLPMQACIELELSWQRSPEFSISLGEFCTLETYNRQLVLIRESGDAADIGLVQQLSAGKGSLRLQLYIDRSSGQCAAVSPLGEQLATVELPTESAQKACVLAIQNHTGQFNLDQLVIRRWNGTMPGEVDAGVTNLHLADGSIRSAIAPQFDTATNEIVLAAPDGQEERFPVQDVVAFAFPRQLTPSRAAMIVTTADSQRVCGDLQEVRDGNLVVFSPSASVALKIPLNEIVSLVGLPKDGDKPFRERPEGRLGSFVGDGTHSRGALVENSGDQPSGRLHWHPVNSTNSASLSGGASGRIVYRDSPKQSKKPSKKQPKAPSLLGQVFRVLGTSKRADHKGDEYDEVLILRGGDSFPCYVDAADETEVSFTSPFVECTSLPRHEIKAWQNMTTSELDSLAEDKRKRLLTLPRMQRNSPPTHLIESKRGDFLRGRLVEMNGEVLVVEVRLENQDIERNRVGRVVWLEDDPFAPDVVDESAQPVEHSHAVQALHRDGVRLTFVPTEHSDGIIHGQSQTLGQCHIDLRRVDQLLMGDAINQAASDVVSEYWRLRPAVDPRFVNDDASESGGPTEGVESDLVGKPAPEFQLELLDGSKFKLSEQQGKVIVLDFWATWCGPCIQAMPQVEAVVSEFEQQDVKLVAVNMQEDSETIRSLLERIEVDPTVALDIDGATAEKYSVTAIPQTVVVDKQGNVAALFVGGGPRLVEQLREALQREVVRP